MLDILRRYVTFVSVQTIKTNVMITKEEQKMYPKTMLVGEFPMGVDTRNTFLSIGGWEEVVNNRTEESAFYENLCHESNLVLKIKLPNGVIK